MNSKDTNRKPTEQITASNELDGILNTPKDLVANSIPQVLAFSTMNESLTEASKLEIPDQLFGSMFYKGELCILFADTNRGKSILAVQIGDSISKGISVLGMNSKLKAQPVAYLDIELYGKQFESRYVNDNGIHYEFSSQFYRLVIKPESIDEASPLEKQVITGIERIAKETGVKIFIIDNISALIIDSEKASNAIRLMKELNNLKKTLGISFLVLAHTPKIDNTIPITINHLAGSKALGNFIDSAFALGTSVTNEKIRYIKQVKARYTEIEFGADNVLVCHIQKGSDGMLRFEDDETAKEILFLRTYRDYEKDARDERIVKLKDEKKMTLEKIGHEYGLTKGAVSKIYKRYKKNHPDK